MCLYSIGSSSICALFSFSHSFSKSCKIGQYRAKNCKIVLVIVFQNEYVVYNLVFLIIIIKKLNDAFERAY